MKLLKSVIFSNLKNKDILFYSYDSIDSTNNEAKRLLGKSDNSLLIVSEAQTNGRGRMGRTFFSPRSSGIYLSYVFKPSGSVCDNVAVTSAAAVAVAKAINDVLGVSCKIKWVNDIYFDGKKVCGILTEAVGEYIIVGIGINVSTKEFPDEIKNIAGSVGDESTDRSRIVASVINNLETLIVGLPKRTFLEEYRELSLVIGKPITYIIQGENRCGIAQSIDENGCLVVKDSDGRQVILNSGEITIRV